MMTIRKTGYFLSSGMHLDREKKAEIMAATLPFSVFMSILSRKQRKSSWSQLQAK
ncbi:hypothetical protein [Brevibacillus gelatini]|uniref:hypothetical protein n=1 Tax=Brevibacillus gelatini TaxID=1655277 RepID=UPI001FE9E4B5|nr:hypothetical protein [Brevibacillus gelatini]